MTHLWVVQLSTGWNGLLQLRRICLNTLLLQEAPGGSVTHYVTSSFSRQVSSLWLTQKYQDIVIFLIYVSWEKYGSFLCILVSWLSLFPQHKGSTGTGQLGLWSPPLKDKITHHAWANSIKLLSQLSSTNFSSKSIDCHAPASAVTY